MDTRERVATLEDTLAKRVYRAMLWARSQPPGPREIPWTDGGNSLAQNEARRAASAAIAAMIEAIPPLVWAAIPLANRESESGQYAVKWHGLHIGKTFHGNFISHEAAKAAANTHHRAQIIAAFGLGVE